MKGFIIRALGYAPQDVVGIVLASSEREALERVAREYNGRITIVNLIGAGPSFECVVDATTSPLKGGDKLLFEVVEKTLIS